MLTRTTTSKKKFNNDAFWLNKVTGQTFEPGLKIPKEQKANYEFWDSVFEFKVYKHLCKLVLPGFIYRQQVIDILPASDRFNKLSWNIDFVVYAPNKVCYVEAKGKWLLYDNGEMGSFCKMLRFLGQEKPEILNSLSIVSDSKWCITGSKIYTQPLQFFSL